MSWSRSRAATVTLAAVASVSLSVLLVRLGPPPSADVSRGTEGLFAAGLHARELSGPDRRPQRWTTGRALLRFRDLPAGPLQVDVRVHGHRSPVVVAADGVIVGSIDTGRRRASFLVPSRAGPELEVELRVEPFTAGGERRLGTLLDRVTVVGGPPAWPGPRVALGFLAPAVCASAAALAAGLPPLVALLVAAALSVVQALALVPGGAVHSDYASTLSLVLCGALAASFVFARWRGRSEPDAGAWAFSALLLAFLVQVVAGAAPTMVVSDAQFHAHKLMRVAHGELFPTSLTPGRAPFRFPYGVSFYALLAPLEWLGADPVAVVRVAAGIAGVAASASLFLLLRERGPRVAGLATMLLQLLPVTFDLFSFGNLSNVFGQAVTVIFFLWWTRPRGGVLLGALLLALGCLAHLSSLIVLTALASAFVLVRGRALSQDRVRIVALGVGFALAAAYYATFLGLIVEQLPRLGEGSGGGRSVLGGLARQAVLAGRQWGLPAILLGLLGRPWARREGLDGDLRAFWVAGAALAVVAAISPLEVRYLHALTLPLAAAAACGFERLWRRGWRAAVVALALVAWQGTLAARGILEAVLTRYRPS
jgi:hypothetical protein